MACSHSRWPKLRSDAERPVTAALTVASGACSGCVDADVSSGRESGGVTVGVGGAPVEAGRSEVVEPRRAEREGGDVRSGGGAEAADAANPLRPASR